MAQNGPKVAPIDSWGRAKHNEHGFTAFRGTFSEGTFAAALDLVILNFCLAVGGFDLNSPQNLIKL